MAQTEALEWLIRQRLTGEIKFFSINEICSGIGKTCPRRNNISRALLKLSLSGYIQIARNIRWEKRYRANPKYATAKLLTALSEHNTKEDIKCQLSKM